MLIPRVTSITSQLIGAFHSSDKQKRKMAELAPTSSSLFVIRDVHSLYVFKILFNLVDFLDFKPPAIVLFFLSLSLLPLFIRR
jgi:hypothetical protein